jgi:hypothetical protein
LAQSVALVPPAEELARSEEGWERSEEEWEPKASSGYEALAELRHQEYFHLSADHRQLE